MRVDRAISVPQSHDGGTIDVPISTPVSFICASSPLCRRAIGALSAVCRRPSHEKSRLCAKKSPTRRKVMGPKFCELIFVYFVGDSSQVWESCDDFVSGPGLKLFQYSFHTFSGCVSALLSLCQAVFSEVRVI